MCRNLTYKRIYKRMWKKVDYSIYQQYLIKTFDVLFWSKHKGTEAAAWERRGDLNKEKELLVSGTLVPLSAGWDTLSDGNWPASYSADCLTWLKLNPSSVGLTANSANHVTLCCYFVSYRQNNPSSKGGQLFGCRHKLFVFVYDEEKSFVWERVQAARLKRAEKIKNR